jgi:hypothetical protein
MKLNLIVLVLMATWCAACAALVTSQRESWQNLQADGGLRVDDPVIRGDGQVFLPVVCDVSGTETITVRPTTMNSGRAVQMIDAQIHGSTIQIQVVTCLVDREHTASTKGVVLNTSRKGRYQVEYLNPDGTTVKVREVEIR